MALTNAAFHVHEAAKLQGPLQTSKAVLYTHTLCPYAQRVFLTILLKVNVKLHAVSFAFELLSPLRLRA
jgi:hypothetical protein